MPGGGPIAFSDILSRRNWKTIIISTTNTTATTATTSITAFNIATATTTTTTTTTITTIIIDNILAIKYTIAIIIAMKHTFIIDYATRPVAARAK